MVNTNQIMAEFGLTEADIASAARTSMPGALQEFLWQGPGSDVAQLDNLPLPCNASMMPSACAFGQGSASMPLASTVIALPMAYRALPKSEQPEGAKQSATAGPSRLCTQGAASVRSATSEDSCPPTKKQRTSRQAAAKEAKPAKDRSSQYRGVTKHRRSGRWEAHLWVKDLGRQVYLGGYEREDHAAEAYDVAALKCKGPRVKTNFPITKYADLTECMHGISLEELIMAVRRQSQGFSRGTSTFRGVTHHPSGRWEARIGVPGSKHIYLGLYASEDEAAKAYDRSLVRLRGNAAATNFSLSDYRAELADYYKMQQKVLQGDGDTGEELLRDGPEFERWIKLGLSSTDNPPDTNTES